MLHAVVPEAAGGEIGGGVGASLGDGKPVVELQEALILTAHVIGVGVSAAKPVPQVHRMLDRGWGFPG